MMAYYSQEAMGRPIAEMINVVVSDHWSLSRGSKVC